uniref:Uncharacterized protein n=1 Tax=Pithovirus LCPAC001 TaxID=2506585 RepID=A0A481Z1D3_9VIRU|nr:MAG: hypothetical protein LCPAC001_00460 [Pithovirus LCPAC001]
MKLKLLTGIFLSLYPKIINLSTKDLICIEPKANKALFIPLLGIFSIYFLTIIKVIILTKIKGMNYNKLNKDQLTEEIERLQLNLPESGSGKNGIILKKDLISIKN